MYRIIKSVIETGKYELKDILKKIDTMWVQGSISDTERSELIELAQAGAKAENSLDLASKVAELDKRVSILEAQQNTSEDSTEDNTEEEVETVPEYVVGKWYYAGDTVTFEGNVYTCIAPDGAVCTWSPTEYPAYWEAVV